MSQAPAPLTSLQQGMLLHSLPAPRAGLYLQQLLCDLHEPIDRAALRRAWTMLVERHDALRMGLAPDSPESPHQVFHDHVTVPWEEQDWRAESPAQQQHLLQALLDADRRRGFDLATPPLLRVTIVRLDTAHYQMVWTSHHALFDGRSRRILIVELFHLYEALRDGRVAALPPAPAFRPHLEWLAARDTASSAPFWRGLFDNIDLPHTTRDPRRPGIAADRRQAIGPAVANHE